MAENVTKGVPLTADQQALWLRFCAEAKPLFYVGGKGKSDAIMAISKHDGAGGRWQSQTRLYLVGSKYANMTASEVKASKASATIKKLGLTATELKAIAAKLS